MFVNCRWLAVLAGMCVFSVCARAQQDREQANQEAQSILKELIEIDSTDSVGSVTAAAEAMAKRLLAVGFPEKDVVVAGPNNRKKNMVARFRGMGKRKPILFIGHLDVVEAKRTDWTTDPLFLRDSSGYAYYQTDFLGTPQQLTDASGSVRWSATYSIPRPASRRWTAIEWRRE
jgi:hypothetical protein